MTEMAAAGASIAGAGLKAGSEVMQGYGTQAADEFKSKRLEEAAQYGKLSAVQTGASLTEQLNQVLGNIDAVRAAADTDPTSATGAAVRARSEYVGTRERDIRMANLQAQAKRDEEEAKYLQEAGKYAVGMGYVKGAASLLSGVGKGMA